MKKAASRMFSMMIIAALSLTMVTACSIEEFLIDEPEEMTDGFGDSNDGGSTHDSLEGDIEQVTPVIGDPGTWLVMLYQDGDDPILERDIFLDLNEAEVIGSSEKVTIVSQFDRYDGGFDGDGDWTSTKRFLVTQGNDLETIESEEIRDMGELDMSDPQTLVDFATWAIRTYPAERYALIMSDHGMGWLGGWTDSDPHGGSDMSMTEMDGALSEIVKKTGIGQLDFFGFDACLMAQLESMSTLAPYARYAVASEETEPTVGWAYAAFLTNLVENPSMTGKDLAIAVVDSYIIKDFRITDDNARVSFIDENYAFGAYLSEDEVAADMSLDVTLTAMDLSRMTDLNAALNELTLAMANIDQSSVAASRAYAQSFTSVFDKGIPDSFIDLGSFVELIMDEAGDMDVTNAGREVLNALDQVVIAEKHGELKPGATGISIYFPNSELFELTTDEDFISYTSIADRFAAASLWDDFLVFHYMGKTINTATADLTVLDPVVGTTVQDFSDAIAASAPEENAVVESPGLGNISIDNITASAEELAPGEAVILTADISGNNIGYLYYYASYYFEEDGSYVLAEKGYLNADTMKDVGGSIYPDWGGGEDFSIEIEWSPTVYFLNDGYNETFVYLEPEVYGKTYEDDIYTLYGLYAPGGDEDKQQEAMIRFDGYFETKSFWVFTGEDGTGAPREATLNEGDTFTPWLLWQEYNPDTEYWEYYYYLGDTLTFYGNPFTIVANEVFPGTYEIGFIAEDFDGNTTESFVDVAIP